MRAVGQVGGQVVESPAPVPGGPGHHGRHVAAVRARSASPPAIKSMLLALIPIGFPIIVGIINAEMLGSL
jgi:hypothetical protein